MSVHRKDRRWVVRWRGDGRQRSRSFATKREAVAFEREKRELARELADLPTAADALREALEQRFPEYSFDVHPRS